MRVYETDGSYVEDINDNKFGWYLFEIIVDESLDNFEEINKETRYISKLKKSLPQQYESIDFPIFEEVKYLPVEKINPKIKIENISDMETCRNGEVQTAEELLNSVDINFPPKEKLAGLINPYNAETKSLLSVINYSKFLHLVKEETTGQLLKTVNVRTTNFKNLIYDKRNSLSSDMFSDIVNYHADKEDNMMSLMMELILTDVDCNIDDIVDSNDSPVREVILPQFIIDTSDLGNSIPSSGSSKDESRTDNYLQVSNRSNILSSIGLSEEDKSIQSFCEETFEMHQELADIRKSFQEDDNKVNDLLKQACALKNDLRETLYLNDIINLLQGDMEKVKLKKLPFRIFHEQLEGHRETNLII